MKAAYGKKLSVIITIVTSTIEILSVFVFAAIDNENKGHRRAYTFIQRKLA